MIYYIQVVTVILSPFLSLILLIQTVFLFWLIQLRVCQSCLSFSLSYTDYLHCFIVSISFISTKVFIILLHLVIQGLDDTQFSRNLKCIVGLLEIFSIGFNIGTQSYKLQNHLCCSTKCQIVFLFSFDSKNFFKFLPDFFNESH